MTSAEFSGTPAQPVGHQGARVNIAQRPAATLNGWFGVLVLLGCIAGSVAAVRQERSRSSWGCRSPSSSSPSRRW